VRPSSPLSGPASVSLLRPAAPPDGSRKCLLPVCAATARRRAVGKPHLRPEEMAIAVPPGCPAAQRLSSGEKTVFGVGGRRGVAHRAATRPGGLCRSPGCACGQGWHSRSRSWRVRPPGAAVLRRGLLVNPRVPNGLDCRWLQVVWRPAWPAVALSRVWLPHHTPNTRLYLLQELLASSVLGCAAGGPRRLDFLFARH